MGENGRSFFTLLTPPPHPLACSHSLILINCPRDKTPLSIARRGLSAAGGIGNLGQQPAADGCPGVGGQWAGAGE